MTNVYNSLQKNRYLSYNHKFKMINEYNSSNLISCMFPTLFLFGIGVPEMENRVVKVSLQLHVKHLWNLEKLNTHFQNTIYFHFLYLT
jgi:hypothetical protein